MRIIFSGLLLALFLNGSYAYATYILVKDSKSGTPLPGVAIHYADREIITDANGVARVEADKGTVVHVSMFGYVSEELVLPDGANMEVKLFRNYDAIGMLNLYSKDSPDPEFFNLPEGSARYSSGWQGFFTDLRAAISRHANLSLLTKPFDVNVMFTVSAEGIVDQVTVVRGDDMIKEIIKEAFSQLSGWKPAAVDGVNYAQYFELQVLETDEVFMVVEEPGTPKNGYPALYQLIAHNLRYPAEARKAGIQGKIFIQFVVDKTGELTDFQVLKGIGGGCDEEAIRVIRLSSPWNPPLQRGQTVKQRIVIPIIFQLGETFREVPSPEAAEANITRNTIEISSTGPDFTSSNPTRDLGMNSIRAAMEKTPNIRDLSLVDHGIDTIEWDIYRLPKLERLDLERNRIREIPETIVQLTELMQLFVPFNQLTDLPDNFGQLKSLKILALAYNKLNPFPVEVTECRELVILDLTGNGIEALPPEIGKMKNLKVLYLSDNALSELPDEIYKLRQLEELHLVKNNFSLEKQREIHAKFRRTKVFFE